MGTGPSPASPASGLEQNIAALLCWLPLGPVPILASVFFLVSEPYKSNRFIRFHATQSLFTVVGLFGICVALIILGSIVSAIFPPLFLIFIPLWWLFGVATFALAVFMSFKAYTNESPRLPYVGDLAAKQAGV